MKSILHNWTIKRDRWFLLQINTWKETENWKHENAKLCTNQKLSQIQIIPFSGKVCLEFQKVSEVTIYFYAILPSPYVVDMGFGL